MLIVRELASLVNAENNYQNYILGSKWEFCIAA